MNFIKIDLRARMSNFQYEVRTNDNVKLSLSGTLFWKIIDVKKMIARTPDPAGDVWQHSRSALIQAVSKVKLAIFMNDFNKIVQDAFAAQKSSGSTFYNDRGVEVISMQLTKYEPVEDEVRQTLNQIIRETTDRINRLQKQDSENEVNLARLTAENDFNAQKMAADIRLEGQRTELIRTIAANEKINLSMEGQAEGEKLGQDAAAFLQGLRVQLTDVNSRVELYKLHKTLDAHTLTSKHLASGKASLFLTPDDVNLRIDQTGA